MDRHRVDTDPASRLRIRLYILMPFQIDVLILPKKLVKLIKSSVHNRTGARVLKSIF